MKENSIVLPNTHPHPLSIQPKIGTGIYSNGFRCDKCSSWNTTKFRMNCPKCEFDLCMRCWIEEVNLDQSLLLDFHPHSLLKQSGKLFTCSKCSIQNDAYSWGCEICQLFLCAGCFKVEFEKLTKMKFLPQTHHHPLYLYPSRSIGTYSHGYRCDKCQKHNPTSLRWVCTKCTFDVCEVCMSKLDTPITPVVQQQQQQISQVAAGREEENESALCTVCFAAPKNATFVHQGTGHTACCTTCAYTIYNSKKACPVCRSPIDMVIQNFFS